MKKHITGLALGGVVGLIDCGLFAVSGMALTLPAILSALTFWTAVGWVVHGIDLQIPNIVKGVLISLFLNIPWMIEFVIIQGLSDLFVPMLTVSVVFGALIGIVSGRLK